VRNDVYEANLQQAGRPFSFTGGQLRYDRTPIQFNNWNTAFEALYADAKHHSDAVLMTGDLIDYGRGHIGLVGGGRHRHELGVYGAYHADRNWLLFYYLLASGERYRRPVYTSLGNHDWRLNPYPPFAIKGAPGPGLFVHNARDFDGDKLKHILRTAHGPGHEPKTTYADITLGRALEAVWHYGKGDLDIPGSPLQTNVDSVLWYLLLINPFLDYAFPHPRGQHVLMLDWAEDEELFNTEKPGGPRAALCLTQLQRWHVEQFVRRPGNAKVIGIHAPPLGPYDEWKDEDLRTGVKDYGRGRFMYHPDHKGMLVPKHNMLAIRPENEYFLVSAEYGSFVRHRDWFIRELGTGRSGVRLVFSGHNHRPNLLVAHPLIGGKGMLGVRGVSADEVRGARNNVVALRRDGSRFRAFPAPLYVNSTSAGPRGNVYSAAGTRPQRPGWSLVALAGDGTIEWVSQRNMALQPPASAPQPEVARFLQHSRA
jgi:Calcineurin-like phosphoesterase